MAEPMRLAVVRRTILTESVQRRHNGGICEHEANASKRTRTARRGETITLYPMFRALSLTFLKKQEEYLTAHIYIYMILLTLWESHFTAFCFWYLNAT